MATGFIQKNWQKNATDNVMRAVSRIGGGISGAFVFQKFFSKAGNNKEQSLRNIAGPALMATGLALDLITSNDYVRAFGQGLTVMAAAHSIAVISPSVAETFGLRGLGEPEAEQEQAQEQAALMGACGNMGALAAAGSGLPEEFNEIPANQIQNDGNPWNEIADKIDDPNTTVKVEGIEDPEENAALMGEGEEEDDSNLMGRLF